MASFTSTIASGIMGFLCLIASEAQAGEGLPDFGPKRVYCHLLEPREHPDYARRAVQPPNWDTFGNQTQFATLRGFALEDGQIVRFKEEIERHVVTHDLGKVLWPSYPILFASNIDVLISEIKQQDLFLFDIWGYVPGSGPGGYWQQYEPPKEVLSLFETRLGGHWLGMDVGEQDGRYISGYASQMTPVSDNRFEQYLNFQRHFESMGNELGNKLSTLVSLNFGHHLLKEGTYATIGAETAQALPNGQVYYAWIRGAGKQYGTPWFGNASVWNRWGWKTYDNAGERNGPTRGTSLNLLKRLLYGQILYNSVFVGFENSWFEGTGLSPIGRIQQAAHRWVRENGAPGVQVTPYAIMTDFYAGWTFPRHLYTNDIYRVWGNLPYDPGDYLTDGVLDMFYPGYQDASYFHDESGFIVPTPYGDAVDCLLSDAEGWLLERYAVLVLAGELDGSAELHSKIETYVDQGGHVVLTAGNIAKWQDGILGITVLGEPVPAKSVRAGDREIPEKAPFALYPINVPEQADVLATAGERVAAATFVHGKGRVTVLASPFGIGTTSTVSGKIANGVDQPLQTPYPLLNHVKLVLDSALRAQVLFDAGKGLSLTVCRKGAGLYTLGISNNTLGPLPFQIVSHCGPLLSVEESVLDQSEKGAEGYLPLGFEQAVIGVSDGATIAGGDVRIFSVRVQEEGVGEIRHRAPNPRPKGRFLPLRGQRPVQKEILSRSSFFEHFDGVSVDWRYLQVRDTEALEHEAGWLERQGVRLWIDLSSGINLYPDLRLVNNDSARFEPSMAAIQRLFDKARAFGARNVVLCLHRTPENNFTHEQTRVSFHETLRMVCAWAEERGITVHLRMSPKARAGFEDALDVVKAVGASNLRLALSSALLLEQHVTPEQLRAKLEGRGGLWLLSTPLLDQNGSRWTVNGRLAAAEESAALASLIAAAPDVPMALDGVYRNRDEEYRDACIMNQLAGKQE